MGVRSSWLQRGLELVVAVGLVLIIGLVLRPVRRGSYKPVISEVRWKGSELHGALNKYREDYGDFPTGDYAAVCKALMGANPNKFRFIDWNTNAIDRSGALLDAWGPPYRIVISNDVVVRVVSAGPDRKFRDEDDIDDVQK